jgi:DNA-binding MarR family transcriptional regulator
MKTPDNRSQVAQAAISQTRISAARRGLQGSPAMDDLASQAQRTLAQISRQSGIGDPKTCFCVLTLLTAGRRVREALGTLMGVDAVSEGSLATLVMLYALDPVPSTAADLAYHAQVTRSSMTQILDSLERRGYLTRGTNSEDRRRHFIHLTDRGREAAATVSQQFLRAADDLASGFSVNEYTTLIDTCQQLIERASRVRS